MRTITVYLDEDERRASPSKSLLLGGLLVMAMLALAERREVTPPSPPTTTTIVKTETVVQLVPVPATCEPFGPPAPTDTGTTPHPPPAPSPLVEGRRRLGRRPSVSPLGITFHHTGWESVAIMNPYAKPIRIRRVVVKGASGLDVVGAKQCVGTLRPGEHCRFNVFAHDAAFGNASTVRIDVHYDGGATPVTMFVSARQAQ
jgi:hypothetical protein